MISSTESMDFSGHVTEPGSSLIEPGVMNKFSGFISHPGIPML